jgi:hypothetical protein
MAAAAALAVNNNGKTNQSDAPTSLLSAMHAPFAIQASGLSSTAAVSRIVTSALRAASTIGTAAVSFAPQSMAESEQRWSIDDPTSLILQQLQFVNDVPHSSHVSVAVLPAATFGFAPSDAADAVRAHAIAAQILGRDDDGLDGCSASDYGVSRNANSTLALDSESTAAAAASMTKPLSLPPLTLPKPSSPSPTACAPSKLCISLPAIAAVSM